MFVLRIIVIEKRLENLCCFGKIFVNLPQIAVNDDRNEVWMPDTVYVFEMKADGTAREALAQIDTKSYAIPYETGSRRVVKVGVKFDKDTRVPEDWVIE